MAITTTTRTHLVYQFIILTLLFLGIGYNELLPDRKFVLLLAFVPIFCYQLLILSCCMELLPVPRWMNFLEPAVEKTDSEARDFGCNPPGRSLASTSVSSLAGSKKRLSFPDISEIPCQRRWEKSVTNLGATPKCFAYPLKSKSWMNLDDSKSSERLLLREGSVDVLDPLSDSGCISRITNNFDKLKNREERATKARSWKPLETKLGSSEKADITKSTSLSMESAEQTLLNCTLIPKEESELSKSYSFPFRQKRFETWLDTKDCNVGESNQSLDMPYWQTLGYNLAVKYEARRRRKATSNPTKSELHCDESVRIGRTPVEIAAESCRADKQNSKKCAKSASACINKIKVGFSNLRSKRKDDMSESGTSKANKAVKSNLLLKLKNKNVSCPLKEKVKYLNMPEFPKFLGNDRPLIFYPKHLPYEKERFETDVKQKMKELDDEQQTNYSS